jgi:hypothetical protein
MKTLKIKFVYGQEFWNELNNLASNAKKRIVILSAYQGEQTFNWLKAKVPTGVPFVNICRDDNTQYKDRQKVSYIPSGAISISDKTFHGKMYLIDNKVIVGSQNLYNVALESSKNQQCKEGEFSVVLEFEEETSTMILYQALLSFIKNLAIEEEPVDLNFLDFYEKECPFCGSWDIPDPFSLHTCPEYSMGDYITDDECSSFKGDGACKYCVSEKVETIGESYCCSGCGIGIHVKSRSLIFHAINPLTDKQKELKQAKEFLRVFKFFNKHKSAKEIVKALGLAGIVYHLDLDRTESALVNIEIAKEMMGKKNP